MRPRGLCDKLNQVLDEGLAGEVFLAVQHHSLTGPPSLQTLGPRMPIGMVSPGGIGAEEFIQLLETGRYSAVFADAAIMTLECTFNRERLEAHRYTFIPCPFDPELISMRPEVIPIADWLRESVLPCGASVTRSVGTFRFDCVRTQPRLARDPHPVSHLTFGSAECRLPVRGPLSPTDFLNFIFDNFYRAHRRFWLDHAPYLTCAGVEPTITWEEEQLHHIQWAEE